MTTIRARAGIDQMDEHAVHALQIRKLLRDLFGFSTGQLAQLRAIGAVLQPQQFRDFIEREAQFLGAFDEADAIDGANWVIPKRAARDRYGKQLALLVIANGLDTDLGCAGELSDR